jgi:hypothetical protein
VFPLRDVEGLSTEETAETLGLSILPSSRAWPARGCNCAAPGRFAKRKSGLRGTCANGY